MMFFDTTVGTFLGPPFEVYLVAVLPKGGPRKVPTMVSKSIICCSHNTQK